MINRFLLSLVILSALPSYAVEVNLKVSEAASFLYFLDSGFGEPFSSPAIFEIIKATKTEVFSEDVAKEEYRQLKSYLRNGFNFPDSLENRPEGFWAEDAINILAVQSRSLIEFESQLPAYLPYKGVVIYQNLKKKTYPLFKDLLWAPTLPRHKTEIKKSLDVMQNTKFNALLEKARLFYRTDYPETLPFVVGLVPIPAFKFAVKNSSATSFGNVQLVPFYIEDGLRENLDVIFHEFCHALYKGQSKLVQDEIDRFYLSKDDPHALLAYRYLNESLATAWGNGFYAEKLSGALSKKSWYNDKYIDAFAKAYLPLVKNYVKANKHIDKSFFKKTIDIAKEIFPEGGRDFAPNFVAIQTFFDNAELDSHDILSVLRRNFRIQSIDSKSSTHPISKEMLFNNPVKSKVIVSKNWQSIEPKLSSLVNISEKLGSKNEEFLAVIPYKGAYIFWINMFSKEGLQKLVDKLKSLEKLPQQSLVLRL